MLVTWGVSEPPVGHEDLCKEAGHEDPHLVGDPLIRLEMLHPRVL